jgi:hypothetical protein
MTYKEYLSSGLSDITCCFGGCNNYYWSMSAYDLLMFGLGSFVIISMLLLYYNKIPKSNHNISELNNPIYQTKDILLQSNSSSANLIITQSTTSTWVKVLAFILIAFVVVIPVDQLFSVVNSFY